MLGYFVNSKTAVIQTYDVNKINPLHYIDQIAALLHQTGNIKEHYASNNDVIIRFNIDILKYAEEQRKLLIQRRMPEEDYTQEALEETPEEAAARFREEEGISERQEKELIAPHQTYTQEITPKEEKNVERRERELELLKNKDIIFAISKSTDKMEGGIAHLIVRRTKRENGEPLYILRNPDGKEIGVSKDELYRNFDVKKRPRQDKEEDFPESENRSKEDAEAVEGDIFEENDSDNYSEEELDTTSERVKSLKKK